MGPNDAWPSGASAVLVLGSHAAVSITGINFGIAGGWTAQSSFTAGRRVVCQ